MDANADAPGAEPSTLPAGRSRGDTLASGTRVGPYEIREVLGHGGMGVVYRARDARLERDVALKCPWPDLARDPQALRRFEREARAAARLSHPHIVQVHEVFEHDGLPWLALQLVEGRSLAAVLGERGALPTRELFLWAEQLAAALQHAHSRQTLHRDIKPGNVLIGEHDGALLTDFGLARPVASADPRGSDPTLSASITRSGVAVGTPAYMSPEQAEGRAVDHRSDLFSLGAVLYEMCTGLPLFAGRTPSAADPASRPERSLRALNPDLPPELEAIVIKAVAWRPEERHASAEALAGELHRARLVWEERTRRRVWLRSPRAALVAALVLLAAVAIGWAWLRPAAPPTAASAANVVATALVTAPGLDQEGRLSPDKRWLSFVSDRDGEQRVWLRSLDGTLEQPLTAPETRVVSHVWSPDGSEIACVTDAGRESLLQVIPALGGPPKRSLSLDRRLPWVRLIRWIGRSIHAEASGRLLRLDTESGEVVDVIRPPGDGTAYGGYDVRPDGKRIAYHAGSGARFTIWTSDPDGRNATEVTGGGFSDTSPRWMGRDGASIVHTSNRTGQLDLWRLFLADGASERITLSTAVETATDAAPDGSLLLFSQLREAAHLWTVDPASGDGRQLTADALSDFSSSVAPESGLVAFERVPPRLEHADNILGTQILLGRLESDALGGVRPLVTQGTQPRLSPDGRWLAYLRGRELWLHELPTGHVVRAAQEVRLSGLTPFPLAWGQNNVEWHPAGSALYFVEETTAGDRLRLLEPGAPRPAARTLRSTGPEAQLQDLRLSGSGERLAYVAVGPDGQELRLLHIATDEERLLLADDHEIHAEGWLDGGTLLAALARLGPDGTSDPQLVAVDLDGRRRELGTIERAFVDTLTLDPGTRSVYVTCVGAGGAHNVLALSLVDGERRWLTRNTLPGITFSTTSVAGERLVLTRQESDADIWMIEFGMHD